MDAEETSEVPAGLIRLVSGDGFSFTVEEEYATVSTVIRTMMRSSFKESITRVVNLPHVRGEVLEKVCQYFYYVPRFRNRQEILASSPKGTGTDSGNSLSIDSFAETFDIPSELSIDIYLCAKYLEL